MKPLTALVLIVFALNVNAIAQKPTITRFEPKTGTIGTKVYIFGTNLKTTKSVYFKNVPAARFEILSDTAIVALVGEGATGMVSISNGFGEAALGEFVFQTPATNSACTELASIAPKILGYAEPVNICFRDSMIKVYASGQFKSYRWSTGDTTPFIYLRESKKVTLTVGNVALGCFSKTSAAINFIKNTDPIPVLTYKDTILTSSEARLYRWYFNGELLKDRTRSIKALRIGTYRVETSSNELCWTKSAEFKVTIGSLIPEREELAIKIYPNPSQGEFKVAVVVPKEQKLSINIKIRDARGNIVYESAQYTIIGREIIIPLRLMQKGIYNLIVTVNGKIRSKVLYIQ
jgi:hypothetical protein